MDLNRQKGVDKGKRRVKLIGDVTSLHSKREANNKIATLTVLS